MIEERAVVVASDIDFVVVEARRRSACGGCTAKGACGSSLLDRLLGRRPLRLRLVNPVSAVVGDEVIVGIPESALVRAACSAYLVPLIGMLLGAVCGEQVASGLAQFTAEALSLAGGLLGFGLALGWAKWYGTRIAADPRFRPVLLRLEAPGSAAALGGVKEQLD